jgi:hypothetical protein
MTTWTSVSDQSEDYGLPADVNNRYVVVSYLQNGYILPEQVWTQATASETSWA